MHGHLGENGKQASPFDIHAVNLNLVQHSEGDDVFGPIFQMRKYRWSGGFHRGDFRRKLYPHLGFQMLGDRSLYLSLYLDLYLYTIYTYTCIICIYIIRSLCDVGTKVFKATMRDQRCAY
ncbi:Proline-Rich Protein 20A [Manis pentadactyla]|nr:Proline-Rich Protein 20A [Manis pentadactyla]